jgi:endonuclease-3
MENKVIRKEAKYFYSHLKKMYPRSVTYLKYDTPYQLLISIVLSAQTTDKNVNVAAKKLFAKYPDMNSIGKARNSSLEKLVYSCGYYKQKAKNIKNLSKILIKEYDSKIPKQITKLIELPGVGRKTASVYLSEIHNIPSIAVDTHVMRVSYRIGLTSNYNNPALIENDLKEIFHKNEWSQVSMRFIQFGRDYCEAKKPKCSECFYSKRCIFFNKNKINY